jgi:hypothetical protein
MRERTTSPQDSPTVQRRGRRYRAPLLLGELPPEVAFGFLGRVLPTTEPVELTLEVRPITPARALEIVEGARAVAEAELQRPSGGTSQASLAVERTSTEELGQALATGAQELWRVGVCFAATGTSRLRVESVRGRLADRLRTLGFRTRLPRYRVDAAMAAPVTRSDDARPPGYWHLLPSDALAALFPFADETLPEPGGVLVGLALADASPVFLDRWSHPSYSWGFFGTTGSGKTFAAALTVLRSRWMRPDLEVIVLDPLGEFSPFVRALGGSVVTLRASGDARLNPLDPTTTGGDRREKAARVGATLRALFPSLRDDESARLDSAVTRLYEREAGIPTFTDVLEEVERSPGVDRRLEGLLEVFRSGSLRWMCGPTTLSPTSSLVAVDLSGEGEEHRAFHMAYLLDWAYGRLRDRPGAKLLVVDEAHLLVRDLPTAVFLDRVVRHVRHFDGGLLLLTQSPDDFLASESGRSILRNLYATALLRLPGVSPEARSFFGLTAAEAEWLPNARLPRSAGYSESLWRVGDLHLPLAIVASTPEYGFLTRTLASYAPAPAAAPREDGL